MYINELCVWGTDIPRVHLKARRPRERLWSYCLARPSLRGLGGNSWQNGLTWGISGRGPRRLMGFKCYPKL
jgi:hypothetical protein